VAKRAWERVLVRAPVLMIVLRVGADRPRICLLIEVPPQLIARSDVRG
jgi:hypothetical protein